MVLSQRTGQSLATLLSYGSSGKWAGCVLQSGKKCTQPPAHPPPPGKGRISIHVPLFGGPHVFFRIVEARFKLRPDHLDTTRSFAGLFEGWMRLDASVWPGSGQKFRERERVWSLGTPPSLAKQEENHTCSKLVHVSRPQSVCWCAIPGVRCIVFFHEIAGTWQGGCFWGCHFTGRGRVTRNPAAQADCLLRVVQRGKHHRHRPAATRRRSQTPQVISQSNLHLRPGPICLTSIGVGQHPTSPHLSGSQSHMSSCLRLTSPVGRQLNGELAVILWRANLKPRVVPGQAKPPSCWHFVFLSWLLPAKMELKKLKRVFFPNSWKLWVSAQIGSGVVRGGPEARFHKGSAGFYEGSTRFSEGKVPRGFVASWDCLRRLTVHKLPVESTLFPTRLKQELLAFVHPLLKGLCGFFSRQFGSCYNPVANPTTKARLKESKKDNLENLMESTNWAPKHSLDGCLGFQKFMGHWGGPPTTDPPIQR